MGRWFEDVFFGSVFTHSFITNLQDGMELTQQKYKHGEKWLVGWDMKQLFRVTEKQNDKNLMEHNKSCTQHPSTLSTTASWGVSWLESSSVEKMEVLSGSELHNR